MDSTNNETCLEETNECDVSEMDKTNLSDELLAPPPSKMLKLDQEVSLISKQEKKRQTAKKYIELRKYWQQRYILFKRFDDGIRLDHESWFSVTPEWVAKQQVDLCQSLQTVVDAFAGAGGNTIQFALAARRVIAVEINAEKLNLNKHNCSIYRVPKDRVEFVHADFYHLIPPGGTTSPPTSSPPPPKEEGGEEGHSHHHQAAVIFPCDLLFFSPPWGGPAYKQQSAVCFSDLFPSTFFQTNFLSDGLCKRILFYLPRNCLLGGLLQWVKQQQQQHAAHFTVKLIQHWSGDVVKAISVLVQLEQAE